jgi:hypothetical protein
VLSRHWLGAAIYAWISKFWLVKHLLLNHPNSLQISVDRIQIVGNGKWDWWAQSLAAVWFRYTAVNVKVLAHQTSFLSKKVSNKHDTKTIASHPSQFT